MLINNAGVMAFPELQRTAEGREMQFAVNHLFDESRCLGGIASSAPLPIGDLRSQVTLALVAA
jgi:hypothetical protein